MIDNLELIRPSIDWKDSFMDGLIECQKEFNEQSWIYLHESETYLAKTDFHTYVQKLNDYEFIGPEYFVRGVTFWAVMNNEIVGRLGVRLELNEGLEKCGGHIGFIVRPSFRERGIASRMLALSLETNYAKAIGKLLLTCDLDNDASEKTILNNGGIFYDIVELENRCHKKRFWIKL